MKPQKITEKVKIPEGCNAEFKDYKIIIKGSQGEVSRAVTTPRIKVKLENNSILLEAEKPSKREKMLLNTYKAHIKNMFKGVKEKHIYKLKICSGHFPMTVTSKNNIFEIKNFLGEKVPRRLVLKPGPEVSIEGDVITVTSNSKELAGQTASLIEKLTRRPGFDKRVFQDGIYITEKDGKKV